MTKRATNLLEAPTPVEEPNVWLSRAEALIVPIPKREVEQSIAAVEAFLRGTAADDKPTLSPNDVFPFRAIAASDGIDSYFTQQDVATSLKPMAKDFAAGRSILGNHDYGTFAYGQTTSGKVSAANVDAPEYEASFYPDVIKKNPDLATANWLVTDAYIVRGITLNGTESNSLIRGIELGSQRRISISFTVGGYVCGIDGQDMVRGWMGDPEPIGWYTGEEDACMHLPGVEYGNLGYAYAKMMNNRALEESLVYMNSSPSAMLMRKAEAMAARGMLTPDQRAKVEVTYGVRLPTFNRKIYDLGSLRTPAAAPDKEVVMAGKSTSSRIAAAAGDLVRWLVGDVERRGEVQSVDDDGTLTVTTIDDTGAPETVSLAPEADSLVEVIADAGASPEGDDPAADPAPAEGDDPAAGDDPTPESIADPASDPTADPAAADPVAGADPAADPPAADPVVEPEPTPESIATAFVESASALSQFAARHGDAFTSEDTAAIYVAQRSVETTLVDLSAERSVGGDVTRQYASRDRILRDVVGGDLTVERLRRLSDEAADGRAAKDALIRDTVAARVGVQAEGFDSKDYGEMLRALTMTQIRKEKDSWDEMKRFRFKGGRQVTPRGFEKDGSPAKRTPTKPVALDEQPNILEPR